MDNLNELYEPHELDLYACTASGPNGGTCTNQSTDYCSECGIMQRAHKCSFEPGTNPTRCQPCIDLRAKRITRATWERLAALDHDAWVNYCTQ